MHRVIRLCLIALTLATPLAAQQPARESTAQLLDRGIARMGGDSLLRSIASIRLEVLTEWKRTMFMTSPLSDLPSHEHNVELRDYRTRAWRNSRYFSPIAPRPGVTDVVVDTIAIRAFPVPGADTLRWTPLNLAYVDERRELFDFAPERLLLELRSNSTVRVLADTMIDDLPHARLQATIDGWDATVFIRRNDALPRMIRFRADETADFGLAPWGEHEVEFWFSKWAVVQPGVLLPMQRDVRRIGKPYKRMAIMQAVINAPAPADSFAISAELARQYLATEHRPMWRVEPDSTWKIVDGRYAMMSPWIGSTGAIKIGGRWVILETTQAMGAMDIVADWLKTVDDAPIGAAIVSNVWTGNGAAPWFTSRGLPLYAAPGAEPTLTQIIGKRGGVTYVDREGWVRVGSDSLWIAPVSAPDWNRTIAVYSPTLRWLWVPFATSPAQRVEFEAIRQRLEARGMPVEWVAGLRSLRTKVTS